MKDGLTLTQTEPTAIGAGVVTLVTAGLALAVAFGWEITPEQTAAILGFVSALAAFVGYVVRSKVIPVAKVEQGPDA